MHSDTRFLIWWWALGQRRWHYLATAAVAVLAANYALDGLWRWSALAAFLWSVAFIVRRMARRSGNEYLTVSTPLCDEHKDYWTRYEWWRQKAVPLLQGGIMVTIWCTAMILHMTQPVTWIHATLQWGDDLALLILLSAASALSLEAGMAVVVIHPTAITSTTVTLAGVSEKFVEVVTGQRRMLAQTDWVEEWMRKWPARAD